MVAAAAHAHQPLGGGQGDLLEQRCQHIALQGHAFGVVSRDSRSQGTGHAVLLFQGHAPGLPLPEPFQGLGQ